MHVSLESGILVAEQFLQDFLKNMENILSTDGGHGTRNDVDF
jgi:hypothetical protein